MLEQVGNDLEDSTLYENLGRLIVTCCKDVRCKLDEKKLLERNFILLDAALARQDVEAARNIFKTVAKRMSVTIKGRFVDQYRIMAFDNTSLEKAFEEKTQRLVKVCRSFRCILVL